jgi:hypothetical protein
MKTDVLYQLWTKKPFTSFRVHVSDGNSYAVEHPEHFWITEVLIGIKNAHAAILIDPEQIVSAGGHSEGPAKGRMITPEDIKERLHKTPFEPFVVVMSSGQKYRIPSAEHAGLNPKGDRIVIWDDDGIPVILSALHITSIEEAGFEKSS